MSEVGNKTRRIFAGTVQSTVDGQHRVTMPKIWRLPSDTPVTAFFLVPGPHHRIIIVTEEDMAGFYDKILGNVSFSSGDDVASLEDVASKMQMVNLDKQGRFAINKWLLDYTGIGDMAVFKGAYRYATITSPEFAAMTDGPAPKASSMALFDTLMKKES